MQVLKLRANVTTRLTPSAEEVASQTGTNKRVKIQGSVAVQSSADTTGLTRPSNEEELELVAWHI